MTDQTMNQEGVFFRRQRLYNYVQKGVIGQEVMNELLPKGEPLLYERTLWDYKLELPVLPAGRNPSETEKQDYTLKMHEVVKDAVTFYNAYGGYLLVGVRDQPREVVGFDKHFNVDELNRMIRAATRHEVDCYFCLLDYGSGPNKKKVGLIFIPQRPDRKEPAQFLRDGPITNQGQPVYRKWDIYFRQGDESKRAQRSEDYSFICSQGRRCLPADVDNWTLKPVLSNNLGSRDPGFIKFIGREEYLERLWRWLCDGFTPCKLLTGLGGVGKTTLAREFAESIVRHPPMGFERLLWFSAKKKWFAAISGKIIPTIRVDFTDPESLLRAFLPELGTPDPMIDKEWTTQELEDEVIRALRVIPSFVVVDDVDSLEPDQQSKVYHAMLHIMEQTTQSPVAPFRCLITARLELGAPPDQLIPVEGLPVDEFADYVQLVARDIGLTWNIGSESKILKRFRRVTGGSPIFASSILRLLRLGHDLNSALKTWDGRDGEDVRRFAFQKELDMLTDSQSRTLFAACLLGEASFAELQSVTESGKKLLEDDIAELRQYHLLSFGTNIPKGGANLAVPGTLQLMIDMLKARVRDPNRIEKHVIALRQESRKQGVEIGQIVTRVIALLQNNTPDDALEAAQWADKKYPDNPDLKCLLGRVYLQVKPPQGHKADVTLKKSHELGCQKPELFDYWIQSKREREDWVGVVEVTNIMDKRAPNEENTYTRAKAYHELAKNALVRRNEKDTLQYYLEGIKTIADAFGKRLVHYRAAELGELKTLFVHKYIELIDQITPADNHIEVWDAFQSAFFEHSFRDIPAIRLGAERLESWWHAVERRKRFDPQTADKMGGKLSELRAIIDVLRREKFSDPNIIEFLINKKEVLSTKLRDYRHEIRSSE